MLKKNVRKYKKICLRCFWEIGSITLVKQVTSYKENCDRCNDYANDLQITMDEILKQDEML